MTLNSFFTILADLCSLDLQMRSNRALNKYDLIHFFLYTLSDCFIQILTLFGSSYF